MCEEEGVIEYRLRCVQSKESPGGYKCYQSAEVVTEKYNDIIYTTMLGAGVLVKGASDTVDTIVRG